MNVLGIESSCDETGVAIYSPQRGLLAHTLHSQVATHAVYGGVVPELASRDHIRHLLPLIQQTLQEARLSFSALSAVAYTAGPGLAGALLAGVSVARSLAYALKVPAIAVHHMEGHLLAPMLEDNAPSFPFLALLVSGGHTQLVQVEGLGAYTLLGDTLDDAVGEAFDKVGKMLGLSYPGGPQVAALADRGDKTAYALPRPMTDRPGLDFSFSGLKTHVFNTYQKHQHDEKITMNLAASFQAAVVDTLAIKCKRALAQTGLKRLVVAGGVGANRALRERLLHVGAKLGVEVFYPRHAFCSDNGAMIAYAGCLHWQAGQESPLLIEARPRWLLA